MDASMTTSTTIVHPEPSDFVEHGHQRQLAGWRARIAMLGPLSFSAYHIGVAAFHPFPRR